MTETQENLNTAVAVNNSGSQTAVPPSWRKWALLGVLSLGLAIVVIDNTLLNVSLSVIIKDLHTDLQSLQWVITAYALVLAAFTITGGRLGDLYGRKKMFMLGAIIFAVGSFIASISHAVPILLLGESIIEGFGAALMMPATASLVVANFSGKDRATAFGVWGGVAGASSAIGPLLGGYLTSHYSWRWGFRINVFVAAIVIIGSLLLLKESRDEGKPTLDWWGVILSSLGLLAVTFGVVESSTLGWWKAVQPLNIFGHALTLGNYSIVPLTILIGIIILVLFFWWENIVEKSGKSPLVSLKLMENQQFTSGAIVTAILTLGLTGQLFALPIFLQTVQNLDAFHTGLVLLPLSLALLLIAPLSGVLSKKITPKYLIMASLTIDIIASFILRATISVNVPLSHLIPGLALYGFGMGLVFPPISNLVLSAVPVEMAGEASGVNNTLRQVGATLGAAIIGAAILTSLTGHLVKGVEASSVIPQAAKAQIIQTVSNPNSNIEFSQGSSTAAAAPPIIAQEMQKLVAASTTESAKDAYLYSALFVFLCLVSALFLPETDVHEHESTTTKQDHSARKFALAGVLTILGIAGTILLLRHSSGKVITTGLVDVAAIRSTFAPQANNSPQVYGAQTVIPSSTSKPENVILPRGQQSQQNTNTQVFSEVAQGKIYSNSALGFQIVIGNEWQATEQGNTIVFTNAQGQTVSVQSYDASGEDISLVQKQLEGSPNVSNIQSITFLGQSALTFQNNSSSVQGLAVIHNNKVYYIMAQNLNQPPVTTFSFLQ
jgi:EmrB/QacA subfamily drug resistance transporter